MSILTDHGIIVVEYPKKAEREKQDLSGFVDCNVCPCLNNDYDEGCDCNLGYDTMYVIDVGEVSSNCRLIKVVTEDEEITATKIED